jgi:hypothetical protein
MGGIHAHGASTESISQTFRAATSSGLRAYAMGPYSTKIEEYALFGADAFQAAKFEKGALEFSHRLVVSGLYFSGLIADVAYISFYPGHEKGKQVHPVDQVMVALGKCFRETFYPDLIERHTTAIKSAFATAAKRLLGINLIRVG